MRETFKSLVSQMLSVFGYEICKKNTKYGIQSGDFPVALWRRLRREDMQDLAKYIPELSAQYGQDFFTLCCALSIPEMPHIFIEAGASDGVQWSNTRILEAQCGWRGLLVEPCRSFENLLRENRLSPVDTRCLAPTGGQKILFREVNLSNTKFPISSPELSCIDQLQPKDWASSVRSNNSITYPVDTVDFNELMKYHQLPSRIGYLSLDTEGSELDILSSIDFTRWTIDVLTVEHNQRIVDMRSLRKLMNQKGYECVLEDCSQADFWFVRRSLLDHLYFV